MENKGAAPAVAAAQENREAAPAPATSCFKGTVAEDATFVEVAKEQYRQFKEAPMEEHWSCIKNKVLSVFGEPPSVFGGPKDNKASSVESQ
jgi:hypothetical protein